MEIVVFSTQDNLKKQFSKLGRSRSYSVEYMDPGELKGFVKSADTPALLYIDAAAFSEEELKKHLNTLQDSPHLRFGIVDRKHVIKDIAELFRRGAVDYLNQALLQEELTTKRVNGVLDFRPPDDTAVKRNAKADGRSKWKIAPGGWKGIRAGEEYTFYLLYIEMDILEEWKKKSGKEHMDDLQNRFRRHVEKYFTPLGGKIWMWMNQGGVLLFPFDGESCDPVLTCIRFILNKTIISIEEFGYNSTITYKMGLHLGNTVYESRGKTGDIISDTINFLFHIGKQYARPGNFYLTGGVMPYIPDGLMDIFIHRGEFEGEELYSMRLPKN